MRFSRLLASAPVLLLIACGGGGGSDNGIKPQPVATFSLTTTNIPAFTFDQSSVTVNEGDTATVTGTLNAGYENLRMTVNNGMTGTLTNVGTKYTFKVSNVRSAGVITPAADVSLVKYTLTTKSLALGLHFNQASAEVKRGADVTFTGYVDTGWTNVKVTATNNLGGTLTISGATFIYAITNVQASGEVQGTADAVVPPKAGKVVTVAAANVLLDMRPLLQQHLDAIAAEYNVETQILECPSTPLQLRKWLTDNRASIKHVFFVGNIPVTRRTARSTGVDTYTMDQVTDHYYSGLDYPYADPVLQSDGTYLIPGFLDQWYWEVRSMDYAPAFSVSRIMGLSSATELADIRGYLDKNIRLRANLNAYVRGTTSVDAFRHTGYIVNTDAIASAHIGHPLSGNGLWSLVFEKTAAESKQAYVDATRSVEYTKLLAHASATALKFEGPGTTDEITLFAADMPALFSSAVRSRMLMLYDCSTSDYRVPGNIGMRSALAGDCLLSIGAPYIADASIYRDISDASGFELGLGVGRNLAFMTPYLDLNHWVHFNGDPTIAMRKPDMTQPQPQLVVNGSALLSESSVPLALSDVFGGNLGVHKAVTFSNTGNADLVLYISYVPTYSTTAIIDAGSGGRWAVSKDGNAFFDSVSGYNLPKALIVKPGQSETLSYWLNATHHGNVKITGAHRAYFTITCNDPRVGAFRLDVSGTLPQ